MLKNQVKDAHSEKIRKIWEEAFFPLLRGTCQFVSTVLLDAVTTSIIISIICQIILCLCVHKILAEDNRANRSVSLTRKESGGYLFVFPRLLFHQD